LLSQRVAGHRFGFAGGFGWRLSCVIIGIACVESKASVISTSVRVLTIIRFFQHYIPHVKGFSSIN
jgi:hypothetical protein